jgi:molybdenum cofactor synthesis domain-containing protein
MNLPEIYRVLIITLSDRASRGEYENLSGPRAGELIEVFFKSIGAKSAIIHKLIPDDSELLRGKILEASHNYDIIITTGGTGIGPRDITPDTVRPLLTKELPGIMEHIRVKFGAEKPNALLSRGIAGVIGRCLIYTLPGSVRAVNEYMGEIVPTLDHSFNMIYGIDKHK